VVETLRQLGWDFHDLATDDIERLLKQGVRRWRQTLPPATLPEGVHVKPLGGLLLLDDGPSAATCAG
jgi:hypothetical protein